MQALPSKNLCVNFLRLTALLKQFFEKSIFQLYYYQAVFRIRMDPHKDMPPGSGSVWTDADPDPDPGGKKAKKMFRFIR